MAGMESRRTRKTFGNRKYSKISEYSCRFLNTAADFVDNRQLLVSYTIGFLGLSRVVLGA